MVQASLGGDGALFRYFCSFPNAFAEAFCASFKPQSFVAAPSSGVTNRLLQIGMKKSMYKGLFESLTAVFPHAKEIFLLRRPGENEMADNFVRSALAAFVMLFASWIDCGGSES